jgi:hypothetical protein
MRVVVRAEQTNKLHLDSICPATILSKTPVENNPAHREEEKPE